MAGNVLTAKIVVDASGVDDAFNKTAEGASKVSDGLKKTSASFNDIEKNLASLIGSTGDFSKSLDELGKDGALSINFLEKQISDFKQAFASATNPESLQKFGAALQILQTKEQELINSGLKVGQVHGTQTVATQRLSASVLGLSREFSLLPPELAGVTHGVDQILQSFERVTNGTEGAAEKITKFAGVLGSVGLGLAISVAVGLLVDFVKGLLDSDAALEIASTHGQEFADTIASIDKSIELSKSNLKFLGDLRDLKIDINVGKGFEGDVIKSTGALGDLQKAAADLDDDLERLGRISDQAFKDFSDNASDALRPVAVSSAAFKQLNSISKKQLDEASDADKEFIKNIQENQKKRDEINKLITENEEQQTILRNKIDLLEVDEKRKVNKQIEGLLQSRAAIIEEFTKKFAGIRDPFPDFLAKGLPLGRVNDKLLREGLDSTFKLFSKAFQDLSNTQKIDAGTLPVEIKFKPELIGKSDLVKQIEETFGQLAKPIQDAINKGIFTVPVEFTTASEGNGQALKVLEDRFIKLGKAVESLTGQRDTILEFGFDVNKLDDAKLQEVLDNVKKTITEFATGTPLIVKVDADFQVNGRVDISRVTAQLRQQITDVIADLQSNISTSIGEAIGNAISGIGDSKDAFANIFNFLSDGIKAIGVALIKIGLLGEGIQKALEALSVQPELALALGIAFVALSQVLKNNFNPRASGGPVNRGQTYEVNERGGEIFKPNSGNPYLITGGRQLFTAPASGKIIPHWETEKILRASALNRKLNTNGLNSNHISGYRQAGGSVVAGNTYVVNERGREIFVPNTGQSINVAQPSANVRTGGTKIEIFGSLGLRGKDLIAVISNAQRSQGRTT